ESKLAILTIRAIGARSIPSVRVQPNGQDPINVITAQVADGLEPVIRQEHRMDTRWREMDFWAPTLGTGLFHTYWNRDESRHKTFVQDVQCPQCGLVYP